MKIGVIGGGAWGTALAQVAAHRGEPVTLWAREPEVVEGINARHENALFLSGVPLSPSIRATAAVADLAGCDALLVDQISRSDTYPYVDVREDDVQMGHEATVSKVSEDQLFYLMSRGMAEDEAMAMIVRGFVEPIARELPMEYALELNRLIELQMEGVLHGQMEGAVG